MQRRFGNFSKLQSKKKAFFFCVLSTLLFSQSIVAKEILLSINQSFFIPLKENSEVFIQDKSIIRVKELPETLKVTAKKIGKTEILIDRKVYHFTVIRKNLLKQYQALKKVLPSQFDLSVEKNHININGKLENLSAWKSVSQIQSVHPKYRWNVQVSPPTLSLLKHEINLLLKSWHLPTVELTSKPRLTAIISSEHKKFKKIYKQVFESIGVQIIFHENLIPPHPAVEISVLVAEVKKGFLQNIGLRWPGQIQAQLLPETNDLLTSDLVFDLNLLESHGNGKVLASPHLISQNGQTARFQSGGELPIRSGHLGGNVIWKKHGILLEFTPHVDSLNKLRLKIKTEVSSPDFSTLVNGLPGFISNRIETTLTMTSTRTIMISGLFKKEVTTNREGLPILQRLPIIGALFSSRLFQKNQTELVILLSPKIRKEIGVQNESTTL